MIILREKQFGKKNKFAHQTGPKNYNGGLVDRNDCGNADSELVNILVDTYKDTVNEEELDKCLDREFNRSKVSPKIQENVRSAVKSQIRYNNSQRK